MQLRAATVSDAEELERIRVRGWQVGYRHVFPPEALDAMPVDARRWVESLAHGFEGRQRCIVAEDEHALLGWATFGPARDPEDRYGEVRGLYVDPDRWGLGAGRALLARAEEELARRWDEAVLWTLTDNPRTRRFYEANGWRPDGVTSVFECFGVEAPIVHYAKRLSSAASRA
jgi:GNAT superfamily N-acetyltransferase